MACVRTAMPFQGIRCVSVTNQGRFTALASHNAPINRQSTVSIQFKNTRFLQPTIAVEKQEGLAPAVKAIKRHVNLKLKRKKTGQNPLRFGGGIDQYQVLKSLRTTEAAMKLIEAHNTLVFTVDVRANKNRIKEAVEMTYGIQTRKINTSIRSDGSKKAYVKLKSDFDAIDVAKKIGIV